MNKKQLEAEARDHLLESDWYNVKFTELTSTGIRANINNIIGFAADFYLSNQSKEVYNKNGDRVEKPEGMRLPAMSYAAEYKKQDEAYSQALPAEERMKQMADEIKEYQEAIQEIEEDGLNQFFQRRELMRKLEKAFEQNKQLKEENAKYQEVVEKMFQRLELMSNRPLLTEIERQLVEQMDRYLEELTTDKTK